MDFEAYVDDAENNPKLISNRLEMQRIMNTYDEHQDSTLNRQRADNRNSLAAYNATFSNGSSVQQVFPLHFHSTTSPPPIIDLTSILILAKHLSSAVQDPHRARTDFTTYPKTLSSSKGGQPIRSSYIAASSLSPYRQELQRTMSSHYNSVRREESELQMLSQQVESA